MLLTTLRKLNVHIGIAVWAVNFYYMHPFFTLSLVHVNELRKHGWVELKYTTYGL